MRSILWTAAALVILFFHSPSARADIVLPINIFSNSQIPGVTILGSAQSIYLSPEGGFTGYRGVQSATYLFSNSGTIDFGTLTLGTYFAPCARDCLLDIGKPEYETLYGWYAHTTWGFSTEPTAWAYPNLASYSQGTDWCTSMTPCAQPTTTEVVRLLLPVVAGQSMTIFWGGYSTFDATYVAPVPELSTWLMCLIGFFLIAYRRQFFNVKVRVGLLFQAA